MADRRSLLSRFWPASASRRTPPTQTIAPSPAIPASPPPPTPNRRPTITTPPTPDRHPTTDTISEPRKLPSTQPNTSITSTNPTDEPKTTSSSRATTQSFPPTKPSSPNRRVAKSRLPPQPSSPSKSTPQEQHKDSKTTEIASRPRLNSPSPKVGSSSSPKRTQPKSPSKESRQPTQEISSNEKDPKLAASQQEPQADEDVKEAVQATNNEGTEKEKSFSKEQIIEKMEIPSKPLSSSFEDPVIEKSTVPSEPLSSCSEDHIIEKKAIPSKPDKVKREEQEPLHVNETLRVTQEHIPLHKNIKDNMSTFANQMANGDPKGAISDKTVSVITLAGENRGASMQMEPSSSKREGAIQIHRSYKIKPDESAEATTNGEECSDRKKSEDANSEDDQPTETYVNNNSQGINNSIVFNSSINEGNSGVHMVVTHLPKELIHSTNKAHLPETRKAEFNATHTEKLTYQPTIKRRCLKGLFLETSDSDPENPEKPRRHGCRVSCEKKDKENDTDVL